MALAYYRFFTGDYARDTRHLSLMQHGAYRLLIDWYMDGGPIPNDLDRIYRTLHATSREEQSAVEYILGEFFLLEGGVWRHKRCDQEMAWRAEKSQKAADSAKVKHQLYREALRTHNERSAFAERTHDERTASQNQNQNQITPKDIGDASASRRFTPPTLAEVTAYCAERGGLVDPQAWIDHYTANGWRVGKNPMRDWRAAVRTWENARGLSTPTRPAKFNPSAAIRELTRRAKAGSDGQAFPPPASDVRTPLVIDVSGQPVRAGLDGNVDEGPF